MTSAAWLFAPFPMLWIGQALHLVMALRDLELAGQRISPLAWLKQHPYTALYSALAGLAVYGLMMAVDKQPSVVGAFLAGYSADSLLQRFVTRQGAQIDAGKFDPPETK